MEEVGVKGGHSKTERGFVSLDPRDSKCNV